MEHDELDVPHVECWWCGAEPVTYVASITSVRGLDHFALASPSRVCRTCHDLLVQGRDAELAERLTDEYDEWGRVQVVEYLHARVTGFTVAGH
ncbi:MAG: hypothetical protein M3Y73_19150 [Actinomycetota bacterium]|nr:hypothetical protein [Actinomycetota bacterium]